MKSDRRPIALLDSGVGGLSILREVRRQLLNEDILYFADQGHVPYGPRPREEIRGFTAAITRFFIRNEAKLVVLACNAASAASLNHLREVFPRTGFVGMEPAIKPASERTRSKVIGVLTTRATFQGDLYASLVDKYARNLQVEVAICPEFVTLVENGQHATPLAKEVAAGILEPMIAAGADQIVLGCTHFPFLTPVLREILPDCADIVDPSGAVARQAGRRIRRRRNDPNHQGTVHYFTSGDVAKFTQLASMLLEEEIQEGQVTGVTWEDGEVIPARGP